MQLTTSTRKVLLAVFSAYSQALPNSALAVNLTWDAGNTANGATFDASSGRWDTTAGNVVWNNAGVNQIWANGNAAIFGGGDGDYGIKIGVAGISATTLTFNNYGYALTNGTVP